MKLKEDVRNHRGRKTFNFELQSLLLNSVQLFEQATDVQHMTAGEDITEKSVMRFLWKTTSTPHLHPVSAPP